MYSQIAPNGVTKIPSFNSGSTNLGMEDDSAKREYGTHPEDPKEEPHHEQESSEHDSANETDHIPSASKRKASEGDSGPEAAQACPFLRANGQ